MNWFSTSLSMILLFIVSIISVIFIRDMDWRSKLLGWAVLIVYISLGFYVHRNKRKGQ